MKPFHYYMIFYSTLHMLGTYGIFKLVEYDNKQVALKKLRQNEISN